jgi:predicted GNAT family N-acyltransferase
MTVDDTDFAFECTNNEGWQGTTKDTFVEHLAYDADGCFVAERNGKKVGICVATRYKETGFIGMLIVIGNERGKGYGTALFRKSIQYLNENNIRNIYLDGDLDAVPIYEKYGFRKVCKSLRFTGRIKARHSDLIRQAAERDISKICELDSALFSDDRSFFLRRRHSLFPNLFHVAEVDNRIAGYITAHQGNGLIAVGPWAVTGESIPAAALLESLAAETGDSEMRVGVLESNRRASDLMRSAGTFNEQTYSWRMVLGDSDSLGVHNDLFAIGSGAKG